MLCHVPAYSDVERQMMDACRRLVQTLWTKKRVP